MEGTIVVDLADEVDGVAFRDGGNVDGGYRLVRLVNRHLRCAYLRLLPPKEAEGLTIDSMSSGSTSAGAMSVHTTNRGLRSFCAHPVIETRARKRVIK